MSDNALADILLEHAQNFLGSSNCVYWSRKLVENLEVAEAAGIRAWRQLCDDGRLEKVVYCALHNGRFVCYRLPRSEPVIEAEQSELVHSLPPVSPGFKRAEQFLAEEEARRKREAEEAKNRPPLQLSEGAAALFAMMNPANPEGHT